MSRAYARLNAANDAGGYMGKVVYSDRPVEDLYVWLYLENEANGTVRVGVASDKPKEGDPQDVAVKLPLAEFRKNTEGQLVIRRLDLPQKRLRLLQKLGVDVVAGRSVIAESGGIIGYPAHMPFIELMAVAGSVGVRCQVVVNELNPSVYMLVVALPDGEKECQIGELDWRFDELKSELEILVKQRTSNIIKDRALAKLTPEERLVLGYK